jgi:DNA-binding NarL/FixJ family response regulator
MENYGLGASAYCAPLNALANGTLNNNLNKIDVLYPNPYNQFNNTQKIQCSFTEFSSDILELSKKDIENRIIVIKNFLFNKKRTLEAIAQTELKSFGSDFPPTVDINGILIYTTDQFCPIFNCFVSAGFWHDTYKPNRYNFYFGFDIISLLAYVQRNKYSQTINQLYSFFESRNFIHRVSDLSAKEFYEQEKNPISFGIPIFFDRFFHKFKNLQINNLFNQHDRLIGTIFEFQTANGEDVEVYFTFWRHINSVIYNLYPLPPQPPYDLFFKEDSFQRLHEEKKLYICQYAREYSKRTIAENALLYGGIENILYTNLTYFSGYKIIFEFKNSISYSFLKLLYRKLKDDNINCDIFIETSYNFLYEKYCYRDKPTPLSDIINRPEYFGLKCTTDISNISGANDKIQGSSRKRKMILDPIIESGTITWLFAAEKVGKTLIALAIANAIGTGHKTIGTWRTSDPKKVLYIDGEMPGDKLQSHIDRIIRGSGVNPEQQQRAFHTYLFAENDLEYSSILDEEWQKKHLDELLEFDLIILDNYYTLYDSLNPIKFIRWMKNIARQNNVAFLVLDHTNSNGELQGSIVKKRAMDLGIQLSSLSQNEINIDYLYDRYGREYQAGKFTLTKCFTSDTITLTSKILDSSTNQFKEFENIEKRIIAIYALKKQNKSNKEVADILNISTSTVTKNLDRICLNCNLSPKDSNQKKSSNKIKNDKIIHTAESLLNNTDMLDDLIDIVKEQ